ncbi:DUF6249 domain-containing protein [Sunxiuqinia sp. A32]|uniref:DUF6249 domain-containing protein n=1 Tax=Sunxiuqinia sp. A32 TaxID=3461496 RepID=UPI0040454452
MEDLMLTLVWLGFFAAIFLGWYFYLKARNKERMALIERDKDVSEIYAKREREFRFRFPWLKLGMLITGGGLGLSIAVFLTLSDEGAELIKRTDGAAIFALILLFGGIAMIISHYIDKPKNS